MPYTGGDTIEITYNHPLGSGTLFLKANEDGNLKLGGYESNDDNNAITGDGQLIEQLNRVRGSYESPPVAWDMVDKDELTVLNNMAGHPDLGDWTISLINGTVWAGKGRPVGEIIGNTNTALIPLKLAFQSLKRQ